MEVQVSSIHGQVASAGFENGKTILLLDRARDAPETHTYKKKIYIFAFFYIWDSNINIPSPCCGRLCASRPTWPMTFRKMRRGGRRSLTYFKTMFGTSLKPWRRFIVAVFMADDSVGVWELKLRNSGHGEARMAVHRALEWHQGKWANKARRKNPATGRWFEP